MKTHEKHTSENLNLPLNCDITLIREGTVLVAIISLDKWLALVTLSDLHSQQGAYFYFSSLKQSHL